MRVELSGSKLRSLTYAIRFSAMSDQWELLISNGKTTEVRTIGNTDSMNRLLSSTTFCYLSSKELE